MSSQSKRTIWILLVCQFLICLGMSLIFPVMPFIKKEYHFSAFEMGLMSSLFALVQFIGSPIVGRISDKIGRKPLIVWGLLVFAWPSLFLPWLVTFSGLIFHGLLTDCQQPWSCRLQWHWLPI